MNEKILSEHEVRALTGSSKTARFYWERAGKFPKKIKLGPRKIGWSLIEVKNWIEEKKSLRES